MNRIFRYTIFYLLIFLVIIGIFGTFNGGKKTTENLITMIFRGNRKVTK